MMNRDKIKKILGEELNSKFRRRLTDFKNLIQHTSSYAYPCDYENFNHFISAIYDEIENLDVDWINHPDSKNFIEKHLLDDLIEYYEEKCSISDSVNESISRIKRRTQILDFYVDKLLGSQYYFETICDNFISADKYLESLIEVVAHRVYYNYFGDIDEESKNWSDIYDYIESYIQNIHGVKIKNHYNKICEK